MRTICTIKGHQFVSLFDGRDVVDDLVVGGGDTVVPFLSEIEILEMIRYIENGKLLNCFNNCNFISFHKFTCICLKIF